MKKSAYILLLTVLAAFTGCATSELDPTPGKRISFEVGSYALATKAPTAVEFSAFNSKAFLYAQGLEDQTQDFFGTNGETISFSGSEWEPSHIYYWPKGSTSYINFVSWYDANGTPSVATETSLVWTARTIGADDNIMVADNAWHYKENTANGTQYTGDSITSGVPTLFHHMLSRVAVNVYASPLTDPDIANTTYEVIIQSISMASVYNTGTLTLSNSDPGTTGTSPWTPANSTYFWTRTDDTEDIAMSAFTLTETPTAALAERSVLPQGLSNNVVINITYTVVTYSNGVETIRESNIPASIVLNKVKNSSDAAITQWLPNRKYTYNININPCGNEILLAPVMETEWSLAGTASATVE